MGCNDTAMMRAEPSRSMSDVWRPASGAGQAMTIICARGTASMITHLSFTAYSNPWI